MVKKSKELSPNNLDDNNNNNNNPNILNKLFGETPKQESSSTSFNSLFSEENPFRRKPIELPQISPNPNPKKRTNDETPSQLSPEPIEKTKKLKERKNPNLGDDNLVQLDKKKKEKGKTPILNEISKGVNPNLGNVNGVELDEKTKKKKRKRDELEREYEDKKYGVVKGEEVEVEKVKVGKKRKAVDNPVDLVSVSKEGDVDEGYDDESKLLRTVFVGNLPLKVKKKDLIKEFTQFGEIVSVRIRSVPTLDSKKPKKALIFHGKLNEAADSVHAYIVFQTEQAAEASLAHNMSMVGGNHIRVDRACPPRKKLKGESASTPLYNSKKTIFVGNLPFDVKDEELYQLFCGIKELESSVEAVRVIRDRATSLGKGIAYVMFKTRNAANLVCKKRKLKIRDRELRISHAKSETESKSSKSEESTTPLKSNESTPSKRKSDFPDDTENTPANKFPSRRKTFQPRYKLSSEGNTSYQGFQASKSGDKKRTPSRSATLAPYKAGIKKVENVKQRTEKRPSVEARKKKSLALALKGGGAPPKQAGSKRKMDARTPPSSSKHKKIRKSK